MLAIMFLTCICPFMKRSFSSSSKVSYFISKAHFLKYPLLLLDLPAVKEEILVQKQKPSTSALPDLPTVSASSDLRNIIVSRKRKAYDCRKVAWKILHLLNAEIDSKIQLQVSREDLMKNRQVAISENKSATDKFKNAASHQMFCTNDGGHLFEHATVTINITK